MRSIPLARHGICFPSLPVMNQCEQYSRLRKRGKAHEATREEDKLVPCKGVRILGLASSTSSEGHSKQGLLCIRPLLQRGGWSQSSWRRTAIWLPRTICRTSIPLLQFQDLQDYQSSTSSGMASCGFIRSSQAHHPSNICVDAVNMLGPLNVPPRGVPLQGVLT